jgi:multidrug transporter EmrE-like cation transporter
MSEITENINWLAVVIGAVLSFLLGWLWYSPKLFGTKWAEGVGVKMTNGASMPVQPLIVQAIGTFLLSWLVGVTAKNNALLTIILAAVTFMVLIDASGYFTKKSAYARLTEMGFVAAMVIVMIIVQGIF